MVIAVSQASAFSSYRLQRRLVLIEQLMRVIQIYKLKTTDGQQVTS